MGGGGGFLGTVLNVASFFVPALKPVALAVGMFNALESGNPLGIISSGLGLSGIFNPADTFTGYGIDPWSDAAQTTFDAGSDIFPSAAPAYEDIGAVGSNYDYQAPEGFTSVDGGEASYNLGSKLFSGDVNATDFSKGISQDQYGNVTGVNTSEGMFSFDPNTNPDLYDLGKSSIPEGYDKIGFTGGNLGEDLATGNTQTQDFITQGLSSQGTVDTTGTLGDTQTPIDATGLVETNTPTQETTGTLGATNPSLDRGGNSMTTAQESSGGGFDLGKIFGGSGKMDAMGLLKAGSGLAGFFNNRSAGQDIMDASQKYGADPFEQQRQFGFGKLQQSYNDPRAAFQEFQGTGVGQQIARQSAARGMPKHIAENAQYRAFLQTMPQYRQPLTTLSGLHNPYQGIGANMYMKGRDMQRGSLDQLTGALGSIFQNKVGLGGVGSGASTGYNNDYVPSPYYDQNMVHSSYSPATEQDYYSMEMP